MDKALALFGALLLGLGLGVFLGMFLSKDPRQASYPNIQWLACDEGKVCLTYADFRRLDRAMASLQEERVGCLQKLGR
jgi:hypothetical protein